MQRETQTIVTPPGFWTRMVLHLALRSKSYWQADSDVCSTVPMAPCTNRTWAENSCPQCPGRDWAKQMGPGLGPGPGPP